MAVENPLQNAIFSVFSSSTDKEAVGFIHSPPTHFVYSARALILAIYIRCISVGFFFVEAATTPIVSLVQAQLAGGARFRTVNPVVSYSPVRGSRDLVAARDT